MLCSVDLYLLESLQVFGAERMVLQETLTAPSAHFAGCSPPAGWGPEQLSPPTAELEKDLPVQYREHGRKKKNLLSAFSELIQLFTSRLIGWLDN